MNYDKKWWELKSELACERSHIDPTMPGLRFREYERDHISVTDLRVTSNDAAQHLGCSQGTYLTATYAPFFSSQSASGIILYELLASLLPPPYDAPILAVGMGNRNITADSVGPRVTALLHATSHTAPGGLAVLTPDVMERSGMVTTETILAVSRHIHPRAIVAIDSLTTKSIARLCSTIQLTNTGIIPGNGIRASGSVLNENAAGCPVISIGIPTLIQYYSLRAEASDIDTPPGDKHDKIFFSPAELDNALTTGCGYIADAINMLTEVF